MGNVGPVPLPSSGPRLSWAMPWFRRRGRAPTHLPGPAEGQRAPRAPWRMESGPLPRLPTPQCPSRAAPPTLSACQPHGCPQTTPENPTGPTAPSGAFPQETPPQNRLCWPLAHRLGSVRVRALLQRARGASEHGRRERTSSGRADAVRDSTVPRPSHHEADPPPRPCRHQAVTTGPGPTFSPDIQQAHRKVSRSKRGGDAGQEQPESEAPTCHGRLWPRTTHAGQRKPCSPTAPRMASHEGSGNTAAGTGPPRLCPVGAMAQQRQLGGHPGHVLAGARPPTLRRPWHPGDMEMHEVQPNASQHRGLGSGDPRTRASNPLPGTPPGRRWCPTVPARSHWAVNLEDKQKRSEGGQRPDGEPALPRAGP